MSKAAICAENLGKKYLIGHHTANRSYVALRDVLIHQAHRFWRTTKDLLRGRPIIPGDVFEEVWALRGLDFEVQPGEVVGIIGPNGAGKSTLLKILSRITEPTVGRVTIRGRVASLLEVGTGFHPELTGRENVFLNGAVLGMTRAEVKKKFDEIVAFAEVERFLDTPVKRYSSGMYVRLAFAVAAHLEPEILLVDEVLAVGDASFQQKCLGRMGDVADAGRTVVFVSHNMAAIQNLCKRAFLLDNGQFQFRGYALEAVQFYLSQTSGARDLCLPIINGISLDIEVRPVSQPSGPLTPGQPIEFIAQVSTDKPIPRAGLGIGITDLRAQRIVTLHTHFQTNAAWSVQRHVTFRAEWEEFFLCPGTYFLTVSVFDGSHTLANWINAGSIVVGEADYFGTGRLPDPRYQGHILARSTWTAETDSE